MVALTTFLPRPRVTPRPARILYWPVDVDEHAAWAAALAPYAVHVVSDREALDRALREGGADVIVSGWRAELTQLAAKLTTPLVVVGTTLPPALVDAVAAGAPIRHVARPHGLEDELARLTRAPRAAGPRHAVPDLRVYLAGERVADVADLSNDGISFIVEDEELSSLLPGCELGPLLVRNGERVALDNVSATVRHVEPLDPPGRYRVGCALRIVPAPAPPPALLRDRALCAALIKTGLRSGVQIAPLDSGTVPAAELQLSEAHVDAAAGTLVAQVADVDPELLSGLVRGRFEVAGRLYRFTSVVTGTAPLTLALPTTLEESQQRAAARHRPAADEPITVELRSALGGEPIHKTLIDLSTSGMSFEIDPNRELLPLGLRLGVVLHCGELTLHAAASVRTFVREPGRLRCGVELMPLDEATHARLSDHLMRNRFPDVEDGASTGFDELADFFRATGFLYPAKEAVIAPIMDQVRHTFEQLHGRPSRLFKSVVARHGDTLVGHVSSIRLYQRTWMSQHLAATSSKHVSHLLNLGAAEYFGQSPDLEYFKIFFQRDIKWPSRVFGGFARTLRDSKQSDLRELRHIGLATTGPLPFTPPADLEVMEASDDADLALVERHFVRREPALLLRSDDLLRRDLTLGPLNKQYAKLGLFRRRRVVLALRRGVCVGFALAEVSSPGLNLSEALSLFRLHLTDEDHPLADQVRMALLAGLQTVYRQAGRAYAGGLIRADEAPAYARIGVQPDDTWLQWTCHRALYPRFCDYVDRLFEVLRRRRERQ